MRSTLLVLLAGCDAVFGLSSAPVTDGNPAGDLDCPSSYVKTSTGNYHLLDTHLSFIDAETACVADGTPGASGKTHLAVMAGTGMTGEENVVFQQIKAQNGDQMPAWVGVSKASSIDFVWITDETPNKLGLGQPPWEQGEPTGGGDCALMPMESSGLEEQPCDTEFYPMCECDAFAEDPSHY